MTTIRDTFFNELDKFVEKYGTDTCLFMQVGKFYECYGDILEDGTLRGNMKRVADLTGLNIGRSATGSSNEFMIGMQVDYIGRFLPKLTDAGWTVVVMDQKSIGGKKYERVVSNIYTPGTYIHTDRYELLYTTVLWLAATTTSVQIGGATVDLARGVTAVMESTVQMIKGHVVLDDVRHFLQSMPPQEIVVFVVDCATVPVAVAGKATKRLARSESPDWATPAIASLGLSCKVAVKHVSTTDATKMMRSDNQEVVFRSVYPTCALTPHQQMGLVDKPAAAVAFMHLLEFCKERVASIVKYLQIPYVWHQGLIFGNNALEQLHIVNSGNAAGPAGPTRKQSCLLNFLNTCRTAVGRRQFMTRLLHPITDPEELHMRYETVGAFIESHDWMKEQIVPLLIRMADVEKLHRRISLGCASVVDWLAVHNVYEALQTIIERMDTCESVADFWEAERLDEKFNDYLGVFDEVLDWEQINAATRIVTTDDDDSEAAGTVTTTAVPRPALPPRIIRSGQNAELDRLHTQLSVAAGKQEAWARIFAATLSLGTVRITASDKEGYKLTVSKSKWKARSTATKTVTCDGISIPVTAVTAKENSSVVRLSFDVFDKLSDECRRLEEQIAIATDKALTAFAKKLADTYIPMWNIIQNAIAWIDVGISAAGVALDNSYCRPEVACVEDGDESYVRATALRHPLIEVINTRIPYVPNDVKLGCDGQNGMLLYGLNAAGKSSFMKAIGCAIVMAQAGFYVPATEFVFAPYKFLFTRILNQDNMFQGLSSFAVEVTELRNILKCANPATLVLGDELCSGTESTSATAIVAAGVEVLARHRASFVFATHLHSLSELDEIKSISNVSIWHLHVERDPVSGRLIYTRILQPGAGSAVYGLEVCRSMDMPDEFMDIAEKYRKRIMGETAAWDVGRSHFNVRVRMEKCGVCGADAAEAHHIVAQAAADKTGKVLRKGVRIHKNVENNIVPLCAGCHDEHHAGKIDIVGWVATSDGRMLDWKRRDTAAARRAALAIPTI